MAPTGAIQKDPVHPKSHFHHRPQMSSGNGFYLPKKGIFCLAFDKQCAPHTTVTKLIKDPGYRPEEILHLDGTSRQGIYYGGDNVVVILPMPDSYHADGVWPMEFLTDHSLDHIGARPASYPIGIILHYSKDPKRLQLYSCTPNPSSVTSDCKNEAHDDSTKQNLIEVTNTGTLRLMMRAPDATNPCDHHARFAFHQMLKLLDPKYTSGTPINGNYRYIEPALGMDPTDLQDKGTFEYSTGKHPCFDQDHKDQDDPSFSAETIAAMEKEEMAKEPDLFSEAQEQIEALRKTQEYLNVWGLHLDGNDRFSAALGYLKEAHDLEGSLLISDVTQMGGLLEQSAQELKIMVAELRLESVQSEHPDLKVVIDFLARAKELIRLLDAGADDTKNGADCRAPQAQVP